MARTEYAKEEVYIKDLAVMIGVSPYYVKRGILNPLGIQSKERIGRQKGCIGYNRKKTKQEDKRLCHKCGDITGRVRRDTGRYTLFCEVCYRELLISPTDEVVYVPSVRTMS